MTRWGLTIYPFGVEEYPTEAEARVAVACDVDAEAVLMCTDDRGDWVEAQ